MSALLTIPLEIKKFTFLSMPGFMKSWVFPAQLNEWHGTTGTLAGAGFAIVFAAVFGIPIVRLIGVAAGIGTIAILVAMNVFIQQTSSITRGTTTQIGVPQSTSLGSTVIWLVIVIVIAYAFRQSRLGLRLRASRENERAAKSVGVNIAKERYIAFVISGFICGLGGALYAHYFISFSYLDFYFDLTFITIAMLVVGGMGSVSGGVIGAYFLTFIYVAFQRLEVNGLFNGHAPSGTADLVLALALLLTLIFRPKGITGGKEIPFPTDWTFRWVGRLLRGEIRPNPQLPPFVKSLLGSGNRSNR
jgi:branched-chain amino acid transport system permease protein